MQLRVYVDTSVFGGIADKEFASESRRFFDKAREGIYHILVSRLTYAELAEAPVSVQGVLQSLGAENSEVVEVKDDAIDLARAYIAAGVVGKASEDDALHVAVAVVEGADLILSWNFRHIVNYDRIRKYNAVNLMKGFRVIEIRSPIEMIYGDEDQEV
jgi:predicted nucleic acid-binding protein